MRKYYDEDEDEFEQESQKDEQPSFLPAVRLQWWDWALALVVGGLTFVGLVAFAFPGLCPDVWNDAAVAAGLRPPQTIFPGFWRVIAQLFYLGGVEAGNAGLVWAGRVCAALTGVAGYLFLRSLLALLVRGRLRYAVQRYVVQGGAAFLGALFFICADPVWRAGQAFTPGALLMLLTLVQLALFTGFLLNGRLLSALGSMFLAGLIAAETPMGFLLLIGCWVVYVLALWHDALCEHMPLLDPIIGPAAKWKLTLVWALGLILGIALNCCSFISMEGLNAAGRIGGDMPLMYLLCWWHQIVGAANALGWVLGLGVCVLPCVVAAVMLPRAVDEEQFLPYHVGAVFFFTALHVAAALVLVLVRRGGAALGLSAADSDALRGGHGDLRPDDPGRGRLLPQPHPPRDAALPGASRGERGQSRCVHQCTACQAWRAGGFLHCGGSAGGGRRAGASAGEDAGDARYPRRLCEGGG